MCNGQCGGELTCLPGTYGPSDPGGGVYDPEYEIRAWYRDPALAPRPTAQFSASWADILDHWAHIELDLQDLGIDVESGVLSQRSWRWLRVRIHALLSTPATRLYRALKPAKQEVPHGVQGSA